MKAHIIELDKVWPEDGRMPPTAFKELEQEVSGITAAQEQQAAMTSGLSIATAAGLDGLASAGSSGGLSAKRIAMLDAMELQVAVAEQSWPCHCGGKWKAQSGRRKVEV